LNVDQKLFEGLLLRIRACEHQRYLRQHFIVRHLGRAIGRDRPVRVVPWQGCDDVGVDRLSD